MNIVKPNIANGYLIRMKCAELDEQIKNTNSQRHKKHLIEERKRLLAKLAGTVETR